MALTINSAVSGTRRTFLASAITYVIGVAIGGLGALVVVLLTLGVLRAVAPALAAAVVAAVAIGWAVTRDLGVPLPVPYRQHQVPERLRDLLPLPGVAAAFGVQLGIGFLTRYTYSTQVAVLVALPFLRSGTEMVAVVSAFALGKALVLIVGSNVTSLDELSSRFRFNAPRRRTLLIVTTAMSILILALLLSVSI